MQKILLSTLIFISTISTVAASESRLDLAITPIRIDTTVTLGKTTTGSITLYNNSSQTYSFVMSAEDCVATIDYRAPVCTAISSGSVNPNSLASWISFDTPGLFTIGAKGKKTISYSIHTPINAIPGGHYGALFFNNPDHSSTASISINRRVGSLLLVTVPGDIIVAPEFGSMLIDTNSETGAGGQTIEPDFFGIDKSESPLEQFTQKGKKLLMIFSDPTVYQPIIDTINPFWSAPEIDPNATTFNTSLSLPVENKGTIHIVPEGKITINEENGSQLTHIGKELIKNKNGAIIGEKIVDYLTINEENGNVLPGTNRTFTMNWYGFARESITPDGTIAINYETPGVYYSRITRENNGFLYPWEKLSLKHTIKNLEAQVNLSYINPVTHQSVSYNPKIPLTVTYDEIAKTWNIGLLSPIVLIAIPLGFIIRRRRNQDDNEIGGGTDEIAALEQAQAIMFAHKAVKAAGINKKKPIAKKPIATENSTPIKKSTTKATKQKISKEEQ